MKKGLCLLFCCLVLVGTLPGFATEAAEPPTLDGATLLCFGDSLTAGSTWPRTVAAELNMRLVNAGIGGNTTAQAKARFDAHVLKENPDFVTLAFGSNDFVHEKRDTPRVTLEDFKANLVYFIEQIRAIDAQPILLTCPYLQESAVGAVGLYRSSGGAMAVLDTYNDAIRAVAQEQNVPLVDIRALCDDYPMSTFLVSDGVHLADVGNQVYTDAISAVMREHYKQDDSAPRVSQEPQPVILREAATTPFATLNAADWVALNPDAITLTEQDGALAIANTTGLWPEVTYTLPGDGLCVPVEGTVLTYDFTTANVCASFILFFGESTPYVAVDGEYLVLNPHIDGAKHNEVGDLSENQTLQGSVELSALGIPAALIDDDGFVTLRGVKLFVAGTARQPVTIHDLSLTTDGSGEKPLQDYEKPDEPTQAPTEPLVDVKPNVLGTVLMSLSGLLLLGVAFYVLLLKKRK